MLPSKCCICLGMRQAVSDFVWGFVYTNADCMGAEHCEFASWAMQLFEPLEAGKGLIIWVCYYITGGNSFFFFFLPSGSTPLCLLNAVKYDKVTHPALVTMNTNKFGFSMHCHCLAGLSL